MRVFEVLPSVATRLPVTILLQGGIASGKSTVGKLLAARGARLLDCDKIAHEVLETPEVAREVAIAFGAGVLAASGRVDRKALGSIVFDAPDKLQHLERLVHPRVRDRVQEALHSMRTPEGEPRQVALIDAAVASKMKLVDGDYDLVVFVDVSLETRRRRALTRGWAPGELDRREARQESLTVLRDRADVVVPNDADDLREAESHVERVWTEFVEPRR